MLDDVTIQDEAAAPPKFEPDVVTAIHHILAVLRGHAAASPSGFVHPSLAAAQACITDPAIEETRQAKLAEAQQAVADAAAAKRAELAASIVPVPPPPGV